MCTVKMSLTLMAILFCRPDTHPIFSCAGNITLIKCQSQRAPKLTISMGTEVAFNIIEFCISFNSCRFFSLLLYLRFRIVCIVFSVILLTPLWYSITMILIINK